jgi:MoaA/NifB/PqqE/SkfB family radical SAM enzyme
MLDKIAGFHIEPTNVCTLKCSKCARTILRDKVGANWTNQHINLEQLQMFLDVDLRGKNFMLCGNHGDPIYYRDILHLTRWIKKVGASTTIITNGSYQDEKFWKELVEPLDSTDRIEFSIDGTPENFTQYRVNGDWESIKIGIDIVTASQAQSVWKYIPFKYNQHDIETVRALSVEFGFTEFRLNPSDRFDSKFDPLIPDMIGDKFESKVNWRTNSEPEIDPKCVNTNRTHYIDAFGYYSPCCFAADHRFYYKSQWNHDREKYNISKTSLSEILSNTDFFGTINHAKPGYCTFNCAKL